MIGRKSKGIQIFKLLYAWGHSPPPLASYKIIMGGEAPPPSP